MQTLVAVSANDMSVHRDPSKLFWETSYITYLTTLIEKSAICTAVWTQYHSVTDRQNFHTHFHKNKKLSWCWQTRATRLQVSQGHQTFDMLGMVSF